MGVRTGDRKKARGLTRKGNNPESSFDVFSGATSLMQLTQTLSTVKAKVDQRIGHARKCQQRITLGQSTRSLLYYSSAFDEYLAPKPQRSIYPNLDLPETYVWGERHGHFE